MAAKVKNAQIASFHKKPKKVRKGIHAKTKMSTNKGSKNYKKLNRGQGR